MPQSKPPKINTVWYDDERAKSLPGYLNRDELVSFRDHVHRLKNFGVLTMFEGFAWNTETTEALQENAPFWKTAAWILDHREVTERLWGTLVGVSRWSA